MKRNLIRIFLKVLNLVIQINEYGCGGSNLISKKKKNLLMKIKMQNWIWAGSS